MDKNPTLQKIEKLMKDRNWSAHRLSVEADLPYSSVRNLFTRNAEPTLPTLRSICNGLGISMADFFSDESDAPTVDYTNEEHHIIVEYRTLHRSDRRLLRTYLAGLLHVLPEDE